MNPLKLFAQTLVCTAALAALTGLTTLTGCASLPADNARLNAARSEFLSLQSDPAMQRLAPAEMLQAGAALAQAEAAQTRGDSSANVDQLAYLAGQRVALANQAGQRKRAEQSVADAGAERDRLRLAARTSEADTAKLNAAAANRDADAATRVAMAANSNAVNSQLQAQASQRQAGNAAMRSAALETQLRELQARKTDRGMVVTMGDVLFDTGAAQLKAGGVQNLQRLGSFLKTYPQRKALIEGYTDSVGSEASNLALSGRRADAVLAALLTMGVERGQLNAQGYGETQPVAGNGTSSGRQMNRRVEIVLSDESGVLLPH